MAGATITSMSAAAAEAAGVNIAAGSTLTPSVVNTFRIAAVADRLALHVWASHKIDAVEFFNLCLSLARGIDYAVANSEIPGRVKDLPRLLKQVCQQNTDALLQAAIMVLMISVKNACKSGWFPSEDSAELLTLADEIGSNFCTVRDMNTEASNSLDIISTVMARFYPRMKMGQILAFLEVKPGYGTYVIDFHISKTSKPSAEERIRLFVAQTDNVDTSSCIITPLQVNFLLNGKGVDNRTNVNMVTAPQVPTVVTQMLKFGTNLLQAVGQFNGSYIIVVAYMSVISNPEHPALQDYVHPAVAASDTDTEIIEGPSRISLNCPISFRRIKTPVKGHSCKHLQILKEVGENVVDVIISADGSSNPVLETNDNTDQPHDKSRNCQQDEPFQQEADLPSDVMDLTVGDDVMDLEHMYETADTKPNTAILQSQSTVGDVMNPLGMNNTSELNQNAVAPIDDDSWSRIFLSTYASGALSAGGISGSAPASNFMQSPVLTDAVSPALNREPETFRESALVPISTPPSQFSAPSHLPLQHSQLGTYMATNEYGRIPSITRQHHVNRSPVAVQALPAHHQSSLPQPRSVSNSLIPQGPALAYQTPAITSVADGFNTVSSPIERQQFSRVNLSPLQRPQMTSPSLPVHPAPHNWNRQNPSFNSSQAAPHIGAFRSSSGPMSEHQNLRQQQPLNLRVPHGMGQSPSPIRPSSQSSLNLPRNHIPQGGGAQSSQRMMGSAQQSGQVTRHPPSVPVPLQPTRASPPSFPMNPVNPSRFSASVRDQRVNPGGMLQSAPRTDSLADLPADQNWRPAGRMRGSLSGRAYSEALSQIIQPTPPVQAAPRPALNITSPPPGIPAPLHVLVANNRNAGALASQPVNRSPTESTSFAASTGVLPEVSSGMQGQ
ncbi:E4 SUMO-protein ligase PIAL2 isoform X4 [Rhododendron vialii]|uniref:E4 SUMO-protein ligase PIAL2 isoform X4 n=1 Tax=Rhododendron vialii TaxID=182163 RepID=UPI00265F8D6A|nr:E4 SUMO-protein ligase PIAL2 isoform X4 [Rhododendron vialii]